VQRNERVCRIRIVWSRWVHSLYSTRAGDCSAVPRARNRLEHALCHPERSERSHNSLRTFMNSV
jgi:hypothetical protein